MGIETLAREAVDCGFAIHRDLGPGLLESVYETILAKALEKRGLRVSCQVPISFVYDGTTFSEAFRADLLIEGTLLVELKASESLMNLPLGLLMNFGAVSFKEGITRSNEARKRKAMRELLFSRLWRADFSLLRCFV